MTRRPGETRRGSGQAVAATMGTIPSGRVQRPDDTVTDTEQYLESPESSKQSRDEPAVSVRHRALHRVHRCPTTHAAMAADRPRWRRYISRTQRKPGRAATDSRTRAIGSGIGPRGR